MTDYTGTTNLSSYGKLSGWEVVGLGDGSLGSEVLLVFGQLSSEGSSQSWSKFNRLLGQGELGSVLLVEFLDGLAVLEGILEVVSVLLVDDGEVSGDSLSDELKLVTVLGSNKTQDLKSRKKSIRGSNHRFHLWC